MRRDPIPKLELFTRILLYLYLSVSIAFRANHMSQQWCGHCYVCCMYFKCHVIVSNKKFNRMYDLEILLDRLEKDLTFLCTLHSTVCGASRSAEERQERALGGVTKFSICAQTKHRL